MTENQVDKTTQQGYAHSIKKNKILQIPISPNINKENAFDQTIQDMMPKFLTDNKELQQVDYYLFPNQSEYKGQVKPARSENHNPVRHGYGMNRWKSSAVYEGEWVNNQTNGKGVFWHSNGDIYIGEFLNDKAHGFGVYIHKDGSRYEGEWIHDFQEG